jgi:hypothetical protein
MKLTEQDLDLIKSRKITKAILNDNSVARIFIGVSGMLCKFKPKSSKYGWYLDASEIKSLVTPKQPKSQDDKQYRTIAKFRKEALKASFKNSFINDCLALPESYEKWVSEGKKSPYEYGVTTGCKITGNLVSIDCITKKLNSHYKQLIQEAIKNKTRFSTCNFNFDGYDGSISFEVKENGEFYGYLNKEYKGTGNGYYYLLINDNYFIGYDVD